MKNWIKMADFYGVEAEFITNDGSKKFKNLFDRKIPLAFTSGIVIVFMRTNRLMNRRSPVRGFFYIL